MEWQLRRLFSVILGLICCVSLARAQTSSPLDLVPTCGTACLLESLNVSSCAQFNYNQTCLCGDQAFEAAVEVCVLKTCTIKESLTTKNATEASCGIEPKDRSHELYLVVVILGVLTNVVVAARLAFRFFVNKGGLYPDDWAILVTLFTGIPGTIFISIGSVPNGVGKDIWTLTFDQITNFGMWFFLTEIQYFISLTALKLSLLLFYLRIFPSMAVKRLLWATVAFVVSFGISFTLAALLQCQPISFFWTKWDGEHQGHCVNVNAVGWSNAAISIALDIWMLAVPLSQLRGLRLHWKKKIGVALMFFVGTFVTVVSIVRLQSLVSFANSANLTYDNWDVNLWSTIEINVGIICACMPTIRQILTWFFPAAFGSGTRPGKYYHSSHDQGGSHEQRFKARNLNPIRTDSVASLTRSGTVSPSTLKGGRVPYPVSPRTIDRTAPLDDIRGIRVQRSFYVDESSLEEDRTAVQLVDLQKHQRDRRAGNVI